MHVFNHPLANGVKLMFTLNVLHLQDIKKLFDAFKICQQLAKFRKPKYGLKNELVLLLNSLKTTMISTTIFQPLLAQN